MIAATQDSIMQALKESTQQLHDDTEHGSFNRDLVRGMVPLEFYVESLAQLFVVHRALESHLRRLRDEIPAFSTVLRDYQFQEPYLRNDLEFFGRDPEAVKALPATEEFVAAIERVAHSEPVGLLGMHYVFEGSNNGSKFISKALRRAYQLEGTGGLNYFDPYGDNQTEYWQAFKADMNKVGFSREEMFTIVSAATDTFRGMMKLHAALYALLPQNAATEAPRKMGGCPFHHA